MAKWSPEICANPAAKDVCDVTYDNTSMSVGDRCTVHRLLSGLTLVDALRDESRRLNYSRAEIETAFPDRFSTGLGNGAAEMSHYFDSLRMLHLVLDGILIGDKLLVQTRLNSRFGAGLVVMD